MLQLADELHLAVEAELPFAAQLRHELHACPELAGEEKSTAAAVAAAMGAADAPAIAGTGRLIRVGPAGGPAIGVRAELDALPLAEETGVSWAAANGRMHACGHDIHLAALTALVRAARTVDLGVALLAILQPSEESFPSGAAEVVRSDALALHDVRAVIGAHVQPVLATRTVAATPGAVNAAADNFEIVVSGQGGHGGYPHLSRDPVVTLAQIIVSVQQVISRRVDPTHAAVVTIGEISSGNAPNIVPSEARARGTLRALDEADREMLRRELSSVAELTALAHGCRAEFHLIPGEPVLVNDPVLATAAAPWIIRNGLLAGPALRSCGADDFSYYSTVAPSLMLFVGTGDPGRPDAPGLHHPQFLPPADAVGHVARALLAGLLAALESLTADPEG